MRNLIDLAESFSTTDWRWTRQTKIESEAIFKIGKVQYDVSIFCYDSALKAWELSFTAKTRKTDFGFSASGTGNARKVFGTVVEIAREFLVGHPDCCMKIVSDHTERSRLAVNRRIASAIADNGWVVNDMPNGDLMIRPDAISSI